MLLSGTMVARAISAITLILTARVLGPAAFGQYAASLALTRITSVFFTLGLGSWILQSGGRDPFQIRENSTASLLIQFVLGIGWLLAFMIVTPYLNQDVFPIRIIMFCAISTWFEEMGNTVASTFKAILRNNVTMFLLVTPQLIFLVATLVLVQNDINFLETYVIIRAVAMAIAATISFLVFMRVFGLQFRAMSIKKALRETKSYGASIALGNLSRQVDVIIVGNWLGKTSAGLYAPAITIVSTLFLLPNAVYGVMLPVLSRTYSVSLIAFKKRSYHLLFVSMILGGGLALGTILIAKPLVQVVYGSEYTQSGTILQILGIILLFRFLSFGAAAILAAVGWQNKRVVVQVIVVSLNIALNLLIVKRFGLIGVALVYVFTEALLMFGYNGYVLRWMKRSQLGTTSAIGEG